MALVRELLGKTPKIGENTFLAEPISNFIGGLATYSTMILTVWKNLSIEIKKENEYIML